MADEQYRWLDSETAERLLSGESLEAVDAADRDRAERLAKTLDTLSADAPPTGAELPGEAAALAAFRTAREACEARTDRVDDWVGDPTGDRSSDRTGDRTSDRTAPGRHRSRGRSSDAGLVRIGGPDPDALGRHRARPVRYGLAAALAVGLAGGVAAVIGTGLLPFGDAEPDPATSVSAAVTPHPLVTPSPRAPESEPTADGATGDSGHGSSRDTARGGSATPDDGPGADGQAGRPGAWGGAASACRAVRDGDELDPDRRRTLEGAAGGSRNVWTYCKGVLALGTSDGKNATSDNKGGGLEDRADQDDNDVKSDRDGRDSRDGRGSGDSSSSGGHNHGNGHGNDYGPDGGFATPSAVTFPVPQSATPPYGATPSPTYSAL